MKYVKTVCAAIGLCMVLLIIRSAVRGVTSVLGGEGTGIVFLEHSLIRLVIISVLLGWIAGTFWYGVRRFIVRIR